MYNMHYLSMDVNPLSRIFSKHVLKESTNFEVKFVTNSILSEFGQKTLGTQCKNLSTQIINVFFLFQLSFSFHFNKTKRYSPLCGPSSSSCRAAI